MIEQVVSGGQTGIDLIALEEAEKAGIPTGGWAPKGWKTEDGPKPSLGTRFGLKEYIAPGYNARTKQNVKDSDGTVIFGDVTSIGSHNTMEYCERFSKPCIVNPDPHNLINWLKYNSIRKLNVAGNRGSVLTPENSQRARDVLSHVFSKQKSNI